MSKWLTFTSVRGVIVHIQDDKIFLNTIGDTHRVIHHFFDNRSWTVSPETHARLKNELGIKEAECD